MRVRIAVAGDEFDVNVTPGLMEDVHRLLAKGALDRRTLALILRQVEFVERHAEELREIYAGRVAIVVGQEVAYDSTSWAQALKWVSRELDGEPYYAVEFADREIEQAFVSKHSGSRSPQRG